MIQLLPLDIQPIINHRFSWQHQHSNSRKFRIDLKHSESNQQTSTLHSKHAQSTKPLSSQIPLIADKKYNRETLF